MFGKINRPATAVGLDGEVLFCSDYWQGLSTEILLILLHFRFKLLTVYVKNCKADCHLNTTAVLCNYKLHSHRLIGAASHRMRIVLERLLVPKIYNKLWSNCNQRGGGTDNFPHYISHLICISLCLLLEDLN